MYNMLRSKSRPTCGNKFINILLKGKIYFSLIHQHDSTDSHHGRTSALCSCRCLPAFCVSVQKWSQGSRAAVALPSLSRLG